MGYYKVEYISEMLSDFSCPMAYEDEFDSFEEALSRFLWLQQCGYEPVLSFHLLSDEG